MNGEMSSTMGGVRLVAENMLNPTLGISNESLTENIVLNNSISQSSISGNYSAPYSIPTTITIIVLSQNNA